ncbi:MAG TPA: arginine--tRNA ligase [Solirubrobacterales bacterium]|nr:arginine--tRNA ligase [Solirubrobacterales bacterium]
MSDPINGLRGAIAAAAESLSEGEAPAFSLEQPPQPDFGDYSTNAAMLIAPALGEQPRAVADRLSERLSSELGGGLDRVEVAGPGFLNLFLSDAWYREAAAALAAAGDELGRGRKEAESVLVEFVSANPTGPLTAASGRHAAYGDSVARILELSGDEVAREYYVNDAGGQIERFALSIAARMRGSEPPEDGYGGPYVADLAAQLADEGIEPGDTDRIAQRGAELMRESAEATLRRYGVEFDRWYSERTLHGEGGLMDQALAALRERGEVYESEGATWLRTTKFGDDKDRVLQRSDGEPTYFLADIAYHRDKLERCDWTINVLGADHHGYVDRLKAGVAALGLDPERLQIDIIQLVHVIEGGERAQMSKRKGEFVTLDELIDDIGADAARFFMLQRSHETTVDLDLELARKQSNDNPVYYVQYAHARIASILRKAGEELVEASLTEQPATSAALEPAERALTRRLLQLPDEVASAAERRAPQRLCAYAMATAADFHGFYRDCKVVGAEGKGVEAERIRLCVLTKRTVARTLGLLGISAPERM